MDLNLKGKIALITGTASQIGIGKAIALMLAGEGCDIISCDIDLPGAETTADEVKALGRKAIALKANVAKSAEVGEMVKAALKEFGRIDILVNTAGSTAGEELFHLMKEEACMQDINVSLIGTMNCTRAVVPSMIENKYGKIINFASVAARMGVPSIASYVAAKAGIIGFTKSIAKELGPSGINVNGIAPGSVQTNFLIRSPERVERMVAGIPVRRMTTTQDVANMVAFLVSDVASDITGQTIGVDGGSFMV